MQHVGAFAPAVTKSSVRIRRVIQSRTTHQVLPEVERQRAMLQPHPCGIQIGTHLLELERSVARIGLQQFEILVRHRAHRLRELPVVKPEILVRLVFQNSVQFPAA